MTSEKSDQSFRTNYYHKLGSNATSEERKNLRSLLLSSDPVQKRKLIQYCLHLNVPPEDRCCLWKILLGISATHQTAAAEVSKLRKSQYDELSRIAKLMEIRDSKCRLDGQTELFTGMYLIECCVFMLETEGIFDCDEARLFAPITEAVQRFDFSPVESYWISRNFSNLIKHMIHPIIDNLVQKTKEMLSKEDKQLYEHLYTLDSVSKLPLENWYRTCFSEALPDTTFELLWDKLIAGSSLILVYVAVALLVTYKRLILYIKTPQQIMSTLSDIQIDTAELAVKRGIESWHRNGGKLCPSGVKMSPMSQMDRPSSLEKPLT